MRVTFTAILVLFALAFPYSMIAADFYAPTETDRKFLAEVVDAIGKKDAAWIAGHMVYPLSVVSSNQTRIVKTEGEFMPVLARELTENIRTKIVDEAKKPLFKNWQGAMVGNGILWFSEFEQPGDKDWRYGIFTIGDFAFQSKEAFPPYEGADATSKLTAIAP